jgi:hypothetical protein
MPSFGAAVAQRRREGGGGGDVDSSAHRQADVTTATGFDTDTKYADPFAASDPFAAGGAGSGGGAAAGGSEQPPKRGWFGGIFGRGG